MPRKPKDVSEQFNIFEDKSEPVVSSDGYSNIPRRQGEGAVDLKMRAEELLKAEAALGQVSMRKGLISAKSREDWTKIEEHYDKKPEAVLKEPGVEPSPRTGQEKLRKDVLPGAKKKIPELLKEADGAFDKAFGDYELAKRAAWSHFSEGERALLEIDSVPQEQLRDEFRNKHLSLEKLPVERSQAQIRRNIYPKAPLKGAENRKELRRNMGKTLKRLDRKNSKDIAA